MSKNTPEVQSGNKLHLRVDRVDMLKKQLDELDHIIETAQSLHHVDALRNQIVMEITKSQRLKVNDVLRQSGIFEKISNKQKLLRVGATKRRNATQVNTPSQSDKDTFGWINPDLVHTAQVKEPEHKAPGGIPFTLSYEGLNIDILERVKNGKTLIQVVAINGGKVPKVTAGNVYDAEFLPEPLKSAYNLGEKTNNSIQAGKSVSEKTVDEKAV